MQFSSILIAAFASVAAAQNQASLSAFASAYQSFLGSLQANPSFIAQVEGLASNPALLATLEQIATAVPDPQALTAPPAFFSQIPSTLLPLFSSIYSEEVSLARQYGLLSGSSVGTALTNPTTSSSISSAISSSLSSALSAAGNTISSVASSASTAATGGSTATTSSGSTTASTGSSTTSAGSVTSTGAAASGGVAAMGLAAGLIGGLAVLL